MVQSLQDTYTLTNGVRIPCVGFGTWKAPSGEVAKACVKAALDAGYRHIDTAAAYGNEADVGEGLRASGVAREDVFLTTKHWIAQRGYTKTVEAAEASLKALGVDYVDLYLVHWPCVEKSHPNWREINASTWRGFEKLYRDGKARAIGVSNFLPEQLAALSQTAQVMPMVNQIEFHPGYDQSALVRLCQGKGMLVEAWSPLGNGSVLENATIAKVAGKYGKSPAQICIRFALQSGVLPLPKSTHENRIRENADVFNFELSDEDMAALSTMPPAGYSGLHPSEAPADTLLGGNYDAE